VSVLAVCARRTILKSDLILFADGMHHHQTRRHRLAVLLPAGLVRLTAHALSSRLLPYNGIICGQSICDVRMWRAYVGSKVIEEGEGKRKKEGETALTNTKR